MPTLPDDTDAIENAITAWIVAASGLAADHVWYEEEAQPRDSSPYITVTVMTDRNPGGGNWVETRDAPVPADGAEIEHVANGTVEWVLSIQAHRGASGIGSSSPRALLAKVRDKVDLPDIADALSAAGIGIGRFSPIRRIGRARTAAEFEPRASMDAVIFLASEVAQTGTYIERVNITGTVT